jgi:hypothetical protein
MTTYLRTNQASLYLGALLCTGQTTDAAGNVFTIKAMADAASWVRRSRSTWRCSGG